MCGVSFVWELSLGWLNVFMSRVKYDGVDVWRMGGV